MRRSARARRMTRHQGRLTRRSRLHLVSLMDIFTILVFFLLLNSSDVEVLRSDQSIELPKSTAEQKPETTLVLVINRTDLVLAGRSLVKVEQLMARDGTHIEELSAELERQSSRRGELSAREKKFGRAVTIMGDQSISFTLLKRVMSTCGACVCRPRGCCAGTPPAATHRFSTRCPIHGWLSLASAPRAWPIRTGWAR